MSITNKRVALYVRVSTTEQSYDLQEKDLEDYARARGWSIHGVYREKMTGTTDKRPVLQACLADARARKYDVLLVWKLDRFFRSLKDVVVTLQELTDLGLDFVCLRDQIDLTSASGRLMTHMIAAFAEFEASLIRSRVRAGIAHAKSKGTRFGRPPRLDHDRIRALRAQGWSLGKIAEALGTKKSVVSKILRKHSSQVSEFAGTEKPRKAGYPK